MITSQEGKKIMPLFSIVIPVYNAEAYLTDCLNSIADQTFQNFEAIVVDDGSTDKSAEICDAFARKENRACVIHKKNGGVVNARKCGVAAAKGEYIVCVDSDDWISPDYLSKMAGAIEAHHPDLVCCGYYEVHANTKNKRECLSRAGYYSRQNIENEIFPVLIQSTVGTSVESQLWAKAFRKDKFFKIHQEMDPRVTMGEDDAVTKSFIYQCDSMYVLKDCGYYYRDNPVSITKGRKPWPWDNPRLRGEFMEAHIDLSVCDLQEQLYLQLTTSLFNVASSQFKQQKPYFAVRREIKQNLNQPYYRTIVKKCRFAKNLRDILIITAMKNQCTLFMKIYCDMKL